MSNSNKEQREKLLQLVRTTIEQDKILREAHQVGDKFRFIRDRLHMLLTRVEEGLTALEIDPVNTYSPLAVDEIIVFVYLYNTQGMLFNTWQNMVSPSVFYEYSVNRPIYLEKKEVEAFIRSRPNKAQHGYLTIAVKKSDILRATVEPMKDIIGGQLTKVKEGSLQFNRLSSFTHNGNEYAVNAAGELEKKI